MNYKLTRKEEYIVDNENNEISNFWCYKFGNKLKYGDLGHEKLYRVNNTFELFIKVVWHTLPNDGQRNANRNEVWVPMQVDMDNGLLY